MSEVKCRDLALVDVTWVAVEERAARPEKTGRSTVVLATSYQRDVMIPSNQIVTHQPPPTFSSLS